MPTEIHKEKTQASQPLLPKWANAQDGWCRAIAVTLPPKTSPGEMLGFSVLSAPQRLKVILGGIDEEL